MSIRRIVPDIASVRFDASRAFYTGVLGLTVAMEMDEIITFVSPSNATAQLSIIKPDDGAIVPAISIEVADVDAIHAQALEARAEIVSSLNVMQHIGS